MKEESLFFALVVAAKDLILCALYNFVSLTKSCSFLASFVRFIPIGFLHNRTAAAAAAAFAIETVTNTLSRQSSKERWWICSKYKSKRSNKLVARDRKPIDCWLCVCVQEFTSQPTTTTQAARKRTNKVWLIRAKAAAANNNNKLKRRAGANNNNRSSEISNKLILIMLH